MPRGIYQHKSGWKHTEETKIKMSISSKGKPKSEEHRKNLGEAHIGNKNTLGKHWKVKDTSNIGKALIGRKRPPYSQEWKDKISIGLKNSLLRLNIERNPNWEIETERVDKRNDPLYKNWRREVYKRDGYRCKINNCDCTGRIEAHHILGWTNFPELRYNINNGITLCHFHHPFKRDDEKRLIPFFQSMVEVIRK